MSKRRLTLAFAALAWAGAAVAAPPPDLMGSWQMVWAQRGDQEIPRPAAEKFIMVIGPDTFAVGAEVGHIDAIPGKPGKAWLTRTEGPLAGKASPILYRIGKDGLTMATGQDGKWPTSLKPTGKPGNMVARFIKQF